MCVSRVTLSFKTCEIQGKQKIQRIVFTTHVYTNTKPFALIPYYQDINVYRYSS